MNNMMIGLGSVQPILMDLVGIKSDNPGNGEFEVTQYVKKFMDECSIPVELVPVDERRINVVARIKGRGELPPIAFTGHMDVVPVSSTGVGIPWFCCHNGDC